MKLNKFSWNGWTKYRRDRIDIMYKRESREVNINFRGALEVMFTDRLCNDTEFPVALCQY